MRTLSAILPALPAFFPGERHYPAAATVTNARAPERAAVAPAATADPDRELTLRARDGDAGAFRELVERHRDRAFGVARRIVRSDADAEEVAQDAFVRAWRALPDFRGESRFGTWLHAIVVRRALDRAETLGRRRGREQSLEIAPETAAPATGPDPEAVLRARRLDGIMGELTAMQRAAVSLYYYEDHAVERVAEMLGIPENTVKTHLSRARSALRAAWLRGGSA